MRIYFFIVIVLLFESCNMNPKSNKKSNDLPEIDSLWDYSNPSATATKFKALIPQVKELDASYHSELLTQIARTQSLQMEFDAAHTTLDAVKNMLEPDMTIPTIRYNLERGRTYNSDNKKEKAIDQFNTAYQLSIKNKEDFYAVDAAHMLAIAEQPENQLKWNLIALELSEKSIDTKAKKWIGSLYNNIGWTYHDAEKYEEALKYFEKALVFRKEQKEPSRAFVAEWMVARAYRSLNRIDEAIIVQKKLAAQMEEGKFELDGYVYEELGECYLLKNDKSESQRYFKLAYGLLSKDKWLVTNESERLNRIKELGLLE